MFPLCPTPMQYVTFGLIVFFSSLAGLLKLKHVFIQAYSDTLSFDLSTLFPFRTTPICHRWIDQPRWGLRKRSLREGKLFGVACECLFVACVGKDPLSREQSNIEQQGQTEPSKLL